MGLYKVPFDFTHEEKVFRWLSIIKTNVICNCKCNIIRNIIFSYFNNSKNNNIFKCSNNTYDFCFFENR